MKSIYFKNFAATAAMVMFSFLILGAAFVFLGRSYVISEYRGNMVSNAEEVSHAAQALVRDGELSNWDLRMVISTLAQSTGNHIFITDTDGTIVSCSCRNIACEHLGRTVGTASMIQLRSDGKLNLITSLGGFYGSAHTSSRSRSPSARPRAWSALCSGPRTAPRSSTAGARSCGCFSPRPQP
ncbi:MAG: hypothetical protein ACLRRN_07010 [Oscillospiraceae bacterium]